MTAAVKSLVSMAMIRLQISKTEHAVSLGYNENYCVWVTVLPENTCRPCRWCQVSQVVSLLTFSCFFKQIKINWLSKCMLCMWDIMFLFSIFFFFFCWEMLLRREFITTYRNFNRSAVVRSSSDFLRTKKLINLHDGEPVKIPICCHVFDCCTRKIS